MRLDQISTTKQRKKSMMENLSFVLWMVLFPASSKLGDYLAFLSRGSIAEKNSESTKVAVAVMFLVIWGGVGWLLYRPR
jgi:uncharacterized membrane protein